MSDSMNNLLNCINFIDQKGCRPYLVIGNVDEFVETSPAFNLSPYLNKEGHLTLNMGTEAISKAGISIIDDDTFSFESRFHGKPIQLSVSLRGVLGLYTPDSDEVNQLLKEMQEKANQITTKQKFEFIESAIRCFDVTAISGMSIDVFTDDNGIIYPYLDKSDNTIKYIVDEGETVDVNNEIIQTLTYDPVSGKMNKGTLDIEMVIIRDFVDNRVIGFIDRVNCYIFDNRLAEYQNSVLNGPVSDVSDEPPPEADVLDFPVKDIEPPQAPAETYQGILDLSNVVSLDLFRSKKR